MKNYKPINKVYLVREPSKFPQTKIQSSKDAVKIIRQFSKDVNLVESFYLLLLNNSSVATDYAKISQGGISGTVVDNRIVAKIALDVLATQVILVHNHPSGEPRPSKADILITKKIKRALKAIDVNVLDHIILTENEYFSFLDEGII